MNSKPPVEPFDLPLYTRTKRPIPNEMRPERNPVSLKAAIEEWEKLCPEAELRSITNVYNCMGLLFASRRTNIYPEHVFDILNDDEYRKILDIRDISIGDIVIYRDTDSYDVTHVATVISKQALIKTATWDVKVLSKWGGDGEYMHNLEYVPEVYGKPGEFWTDRKTLP